MLFPNYLIEISSDLFTSTIWLSLYDKVTLDPLPTFAKTHLSISHQSMSQTSLSNGLPAETQNVFSALSWLNRSIGFTDYKWVCLRNFFILLTICNKSSQQASRY